MESKHTPGPWRLVYVGVASTPSYRVRTDTKYIVEMPETTTSTVEEIAANAKLITAAPDLLEALQEMIRMYEEVQPAGGWQGVYECAIDAINKLK